MKRFLVFIYTFFLAVPLVAQNLVLVNGSVVDGTGKPRVLANVRIRDGKISDLGLSNPLPVKQCST